MIFKRSDGMKVWVTEEQRGMLSAKDKIAACLGFPDVVAYDIYNGDMLIGFAMLRNFAPDEGRLPDEGRPPDGWFLWDYAIDYRYQNMHYGTAALRELIALMQQTHNMRVMTTTYIYGNEHAKHVYETVGFTETTIVDTDECHEVNMIYRCE